MIETSEKKTYVFLISNKIFEGTRYLNDFLKDVKVQFFNILKINCLVGIAWITLVFHMDTLTVHMY